MTALKRLVISAEADPRNVRLKIRERVDKNRTEFVLEGDRCSDRVKGADEVNPLGEHTGVGRKAVAAVVIAGGDDDRDPGRGKGIDRSVQEPQRLNRWDGSIEDVTGYDDAVDGLRHREVNDEADGLLLRGVQRC